MGAAMQVFALEGYAHAGTDQMVKIARISKGLLFHYFISKKGLYGFLYEYAVRFMLLEISRTVDANETDFHAVQCRILKGVRNAMRQYPYISFFLQTADKERDAEAVEVIAERRKAYRASLKEILQRIDMAQFGSEEMFLEAVRIVDNESVSLKDDLDFENPKWQDEYFARMNGCLDFIAHFSLRPAT